MSDPVTQLPARGTGALNRMVDDALAKIGTAVDEWSARPPAAQADADGFGVSHPSYAMHPIDSALLVHCLSVAAVLEPASVSRVARWIEIRRAIEDELIARLAALDPENPF